MKRTSALTIVGVVVGALAGWFYWDYFGCTTGCTITGSPLNSTLYGAFMGGILLNMIAPYVGRAADQDNSNEKPRTSAH